MLGTINLMNRLVTFDRASGWVGFTSTDCSTYDPHSEPAASAEAPAAAVEAASAAAGVSSSPPPSTPPPFPSHFLAGRVGGGGYPGVDVEAAESSVGLDACQRTLQPTGTASASSAAPPREVDLAIANSAGRGAGRHGWSMLGAWLPSLGAKMASGQPPADGTQAEEASSQLALLDAQLALLAMLAVVLLVAAAFHLTAASIRHHRHSSRHATCRSYPTARSLREIEISLEDDEEETGSVAGSDHCLLSEAEREGRAERECYGEQHSERETTPRGHHAPRF